MHKKIISLSYCVFKIKQPQILEKTDRNERCGTLHAHKLHDYWSNMRDPHASENQCHRIAVSNYKANNAHTLQCNVSRVGLEMGQMQADTICLVPEHFMLRKIFSDALRYHNHTYQQR
jgi:hypothetical protein